jgi:hypothetical protein
MGIETKIQDSHRLTDVFGRWPSFHDAEVLRIVLDHGDRKTIGPSLQATIHLFEMTSQVEHGKYVLKNHVAATFRFSEIYELKLNDFNHQNSLAGIRIEDISSRQLERKNFEVFLDGSFGVSASLLCNSVSIESVEPFVRDKK